jgi:uncharacterized phage protein gp47/JayE
MSFVPRTFTAILTDMIAFVQEHTNITDFSVGSVVRTLLEAAALEDDEQYFQMVQLIDIFSYTTATGEDLDRRLADFNIFRLSSKDAYGKVLFTNGNIVSDLVAADTLSGNTQIQIFDSIGFSNSSFPYTIRVGERTTRAQDLIVTGLDTPTNTFTVSSPLINDALIGDKVSLVTGSSSYVINTGTNVQAPATTTENSKIYRTTEIATISEGNYYSNLVTAISSVSGPEGNTGSDRVTQFVSSPPFSGSGVTNPIAFEGGSSRESDADFRARAVEKLQSLSRGTVLALKSNSVGVTDPATGQRVISSNVLEDFSLNPDEVIVYIDDGTGLVPDTVTWAQNSSGQINQADSNITLNDSSSFPSSGFVLVDLDFLVEYESISGNSLVLTNGAPSASSSNTPLVRRVDVVSTGTEEGQRRFNLQFPPIVRNTYSIYIKQPSELKWELLTDGIDYVLNKGTGEFSILSLSGLPEDTQVVAHYTYYTNLIAETQKVLEGSAIDSTTYPGVKAAGIFLSVEAPRFKRITVRVVISADVSFDESDLVPQVQQQIETYINSLKIGQDVIRSKIIDVSHNVTGVLSVNLQLPTSDIIVLEDELPVAFDNNRDSLVTVL